MAAIKLQIRNKSIVRRLCFRPQQLSDNNASARRNNEKYFFEPRTTMISDRARYVAKKQSALSENSVMLNYYTLGLGERYTFRNAGRVRRLPVPIVAVDCYFSAPQTCGFVFMHWSRPKYILAWIGHI